MNKPTKEQLNAIDLSVFEPYIYESWAKKYFTMEAGKEHYRLLYYASSQLSNNSSIVELGTFMGHSALALSIGANNSNSTITTFDIVNKVDCDLMPNTTFELVAEGKFKKAALKSASLIFVDTFHDGTLEENVLQYLISIKWKGIVIFDDIHLNAEMKAFWNVITVRKEDWTDIGHWSGTGIVFFD